MANTDARPENVNDQPSSEIVDLEEAVRLIKQGVGRKANTWLSISESLKKVAERLDIHFGTLSQKSPSSTSVNIVVIDLQRLNYILQDLERWIEATNNAQKDRKKRSKRTRRDSSATKWATLLSTLDLATQENRLLSAATNLRTYMRWLIETQEKKVKSKYTPSQTRQYMSYQSSSIDTIGWLSYAFKSLPK